MKVQEETSLLAPGQSFRAPPLFPWHPLNVTFLTVPAESFRMAPSPVEVTESKVTLERVREVGGLARREHPLNVNDLNCELVKVRFLELIGLTEKE